MQVIRYREREKNEQIKIESFKLKRKLAKIYSLVIFSG